jgi:hypothetical protein
MSTVAKTTKVTVINSVEKEIGDDGGALCFQWCLYVYGDDPKAGKNRAPQYGYRFMWRSERGLNADRGQARIPSVKIAQELIGMADKQGWAHYDGDAMRQRPAA